MTYLIVKEIRYETLENDYIIVDKSKDIDIANDKLKRYQLIDTDKDHSYSLSRYESPFVLREEMRVA